MNVDKKVARIKKDVGRTKDVFEDGDIIRFEKGYKKNRYVGDSIYAETVKYYTFAALRAGGYWYVTGGVAGANRISYKELVENYLSDELTKDIVVVSEFVAVE